MRKRTLTLVLLLAAVCLFGTVNRARAAEDLETIDDASPQEVVNGMANKLARGVANVATGWLELPKQIVVTTREEGLTKGILVGPLKGLGMTVVRTVVGVGETATFFVAYPGFYDPMFDPSYVWQKE